MSVKNVASHLHKIQRHKKVHLNGKFNCSQCSTKFSSERSLEKHNQNVHGKILVSSQTYVCDICGTCLSAKSSLKQHLKIHLDKNFNCDICSANFKTERSLKEHKEKTPCKRHILKRFISVTSVAKHLHVKPI